MKRISFALLFGYLFGTVAFGQEPGDVVIQTLVDFDDILENVGNMLFDVMQQNLLLFLSLFFVWVAFMYVKFCLQGRMVRLRDERRIQEAGKRSEARQIACERLRAGRTMLAMRMGWDGETERQLGGYSSDSEMRRILRRESERLEDNESIVRIDGAYYVRSETDEGDIIGHKTLDKWRSERDGEQSYPFSVRSGSYREEDNDYGKSYESLSESEKEQVRCALNGDDIDNTSYYHDYPEDDYTEADMLRNIEEVKSGKWRSVDVDREDSTVDREESEERETLSYEEADFERWKEDQRERWEALAEAEYQADRRRRRLEEEYDYDDGFDRDYGNRRNASGGY